MELSTFPQNVHIFSQQLPQKLTYQEQYRSDIPVKLFKRNENRQKEFCSGHFGLNHN